MARRTEASLDGERASRLQEPVDLHPDVAQVAGDVAQTEDENEVEALRRQARISGIGEEHLDVSRPAPSTFRRT